MAEELEDVLSRFEKKFKLPKTHLEYIEREVEDALDLPPEKLKEELKEIEENLAATPYLLSKKVGHGAFGSVYEGIRKEDKKVIAVKIIDLEESKDDIATINREIMALVNGKVCPQLTQYFGSHVNGTHLWIAMEFVDGGSVLDRVKKKPLNEVQIQVICKEVLEGLRYLWADGKIHRDIKAANILVAKSGQVKLADFGASKTLTDTVTKCDTFVGSPYWMAPEILTEKKYDGKADIWSLGVTCIEMTDQKPPFSDIHPLQVLSVIAKEASPQLNAKGGYSKDFHDFVNKCLQKDPKIRPSIDELLKHPFMKGAKTIEVLKEL